MKYKFVCDTCGNEEIIRLPMREIKGKEIACSKCGKLMHQKLNENLAIHVDEFMKSGEIQEMSYLNSIMDNKPSRRGKTIF